MGRPKKEPPKRVSGTGYTQAEARTLKYSRLSEDGKTYEVDTDRIAEVIDDYIASKYDDTGVIAIPISRPGMCKALGQGANSRPIAPSTYKLWLEGYVNHEHRDDMTYVPNDALSAAVRAGETELGIYLLETQGKYGENTRLRQAESIGLLEPQRQVVDHNIRTGKWGKWGK